MRPLAVVHRTPAGVGGTALVAGTISNVEHNSAVAAEKGYGDWHTQGVFEKMRRSDPHIARSLKLLKLPILAATWEVEPASDSPLDKEIADFVAWNLFERIRWRDTLRQVLAFKDFGFMLFEVLEEMAPAPAARFELLPGDADGADGLETKTAFTWSTWDPRLPKTVERWVPNPNRPTELAAVVQFVGYSDGEESGIREIKAENLLRFTNEQEGSDFAGMSVLRPVYKSWKILEMLEKLDAIRHERQNVGIPKITLPETISDGDVEKAEDILAHLQSHQKGYIVLPFGWQFEWDTSGQGTGTDVRSRIEDLKRDIADNVLAGFMALGNGDTGSYALAETQADQYLLQLEQDAGQIEEVVNEGVDGTSHLRRLVDMNYGPQVRYPKLRAKNLRSRDYSAILPLVVQFLQVGAVTATPDLENLIRSKLDLPPLEDAAASPSVDAPMAEEIPTEEATLG